MKRSPGRLFSTLLLMLLGAVALHCNGANFTERSGQQGPAGPGAQPRVFGVASVRAFIAVDEGFRADVLANRDLIVAAGLEVSNDGAFILFPENPAGCWLVNTDQEQVMTSFDGGFSLASPTSATGQLVHPTDNRAPADFDPTVLSEDPAAPTPIVVLQPFRGPCGMNSPLEDFCQVDSPDDLPGPILPKSLVPALVNPKAVPTAITQGPRGTYPAPVKTLVCEDKNGILSGLTMNKYFAYIGSTCDGYVKVGCCPNENPFSDIEYDLLSASPGFALIEAIRAGNLNVQLTPAVLPAGLGAPNLNCSDNHKGRVCQQLLPGDLSIDTGKNIAKPFEIEVVKVAPGSNYGFAVHNNGCFGNTEIVPLAQFINGTLSGTGLKASGLSLPVTPGLLTFLAGQTNPVTAAIQLPGSGLLTPGQRLEHFDASTIIPTYLADRFLNFATPATATPGQVDAFLLITDHSPILLVFQVVGPGQDDGTGIQPPAMIMTVETPSVTFEHCVDMDACPQPVASPITVKNNGTTQFEVELSFAADSALSALPLKRTLAPGESVDFMLEFDCTRTESYNTSVTVMAVDVFGQTRSSNVNVVAIIKHKAVRLDFPFGPFPAGTEIRLTRTAGGIFTGTGEPGCPDAHWHGEPVSIDGIFVKTEDPNPTGCGHGIIVKTEGGDQPPP